jgi:DNA polymerase-1
LVDIPWKEGSTMFDFYKSEWVSFGEMLVAMETEGIKVNVAYLKEIEKIALEEKEQHKVNKTFTSKLTKRLLF